MCKPSNTYVLGPTRVHIPNGISIGSAVFAGLSSVDFGYVNDLVTQFTHNFAVALSQSLTVKGKEEYSAFWPRWYTESAQAWITQFYLQITPCLPFLRERSPDVATTATEAADIQLQLTTHFLTPKG